MGIKFEPKKLDLVIPEGSKVFLISDTHFCHQNLIHYVGRPFKNKNEMNETMFNKWNETVTNDDYVIFCGDFVVGASDKRKVCNLLYKKLNGKKIMIYGNHDIREGLEYDFYDAVIMEMFGKKIICHHFPIDPSLANCDVAIVGHTHSNDNPTKTKYKLKNQLNVSCELLDYVPILLTEQLIDSSNWKDC